MWAWISWKQPNFIKTDATIKLLYIIIWVLHYSYYFYDGASSLSRCVQDALQEHYNKVGKFPGPTIIPRRRPWTLLNFLFWATLLLSPLIKFACGVAVSGSPLLIIGFILFLIVGKPTASSQLPAPSRTADVQRTVKAVEELGCEDLWFVSGLLARKSVFYR